MTNRPLENIGEIPGVSEGSLYTDRYTLYHAGVHRHNQMGIVGTGSTGAESIVLSGGYADDTDRWHEIIYTGQGGNDPKRKVQYADQELTRGNLALAVSCDRKQPVRVIRGSRHQSPYSPLTGYRYDGLYRVSEYWQERTGSGFLIWRFRMHKLSDTPPPKPLARVASPRTITRPAPIQPSLLTYALDVLPNCSKCGAQIRMHARFCSQCGTAVTTPAFTLSAGQTLNRGEFTIVRPLSHGGMGAIYLALDHRAFDRLVVIKALLDYFDPTNAEEAKSAQARFVNEARMLAQLRHPAIPVIMSHFQDSGRNYIVMEYIEGANLEQQLTHEQDGQRIKGRAYSLTQVKQWAVALTDVLDYLANRNPPIVHHDIKPANLILDARHTIRLVDFGTARTRFVAAPANVGMKRSSIFGTQGYAPPEQYRGLSEPRSDVYALAATLYHLATDDDPSTHPFEFPQLNELGAFGTLLKAALHTDVAQRPSAKELHRLFLTTM